MREKTVGSGAGRGAVVDAGALDAPVRLLVVDEAIAGGGLERVGRALMPRLAARCERLIWCLPEHKLAEVRAVVGEHERLERASFNWPRGSVGWMAAAAARRMEALLGRVGWRLPRVVWQRLGEGRLRALVRKHRVTCVHYAALFDQPFPRLPVPVYATIADVNYHPDWHEACRRNLGIWSRQAAGLVAISEFTRAEVARLEPHAAPRLHAVPLAVDPPVNGGSGPRKRGSGALCIYYPATVHHHKRHQLLLGAAQLLHARGVDVRLQLTGGETDQLAGSLPVKSPVVEELRRFLAGASEDFRARVEALGYVTPQTVERCYAGADVIALPSSYEGFGLPLSEALIRGKTVVCADIPAFREQAQLYDLEDAVTFVVDATPEAWAVALEAAGRAGSERRAARRAFSFERWTWDDVARAQVRIWRAASEALCRKT